MANATTPILHNIKAGEKVSYKLAAAVKCVTGVLMGIINQSTGQGYMTNAATDAGGAMRFGGVCESGVDNTSGSAGDLSVVVFRKGRFWFTKASPVITDIGQKAYASDDHTLTLTSTNNMFVGVITDIDAAGGKVEVDLGQSHA